MDEQHIIDFLKENTVGIFATCGDDKKPLAVPVYYTFYDKNDEIYFITKDKTKKISNIKENKNVSFVVYTESPQVLFTADCKADVIDVADIKNKVIFDQLIEIHSTRNYTPTPLEALKDGNLVSVRLKIGEYKFIHYNKEVIKNSRSHI